MTDHDYTTDELGLIATPPTSPCLSRTGTSIPQSTVSSRTTASMRYNTALRARTHTLKVSRPLDRSPTIPTSTTCGFSTRSSQSVTSSISVATKAGSTHLVSSLTGPRRHTSFHHCRGSGATRDPEKVLRQTTDFRVLRGMRLLRGYSSGRYFGSCPPVVQRVEPDVRVGGGT